MTSGALEITPERLRDLSGLSFRPMPRQEVITRVSDLLFVGVEARPVWTDASLTFPELRVNEALGTRLTSGWVLMVVQGETHGMEQVLVVLGHPEIVDRAEFARIGRSIKVARMVTVYTDATDYEPLPFWYDVNPTGADYARLGLEDPFLLVSPGAVLDPWAWLRGRIQAARWLAFNLAPESGAPRARPAPAR